MATFNNIPNIFTNNANIEELREGALQHANSARSVDLILSSTRNSSNKYLLIHILHHTQIRPKPYKNYMTIQQISPEQIHLIHYKKKKY